MIAIIGVGGPGREFMCLNGAVTGVKPTWQLMGLVDDRVPDRDILERLGVPWLGNIDASLDSPQA